MSQTPPPSSKLFIRSEVLSVIDFLNTLDDPSRLEKNKQLKRLRTIQDQETVQRILVKELQRASSLRLIQVISELLMELGSIDSLQKPLWALIENPKTSDEVKDAANVILRQLGDETDPNLYLDYLDDPAGLINRETERMLEVSTRNPEALIDFIDFIFSLPVDEQCNLISSLQADYPVEYLLNIFLPAILALPPHQTQELILGLLGETRSKKAALFLADNQDWFADDPKLMKVIKKSINALKIGGLYREDKLEEARQELTERHSLVEQTEIYQCFATIPDGIGNQGIVISRERENGDICMMSVAINDLHGIIDCFGFYELSKPDFHKLIEKFHEENTKVHTPPIYCLQKLQAAEAINHQHKFRIPYEYSCWKALLQDPDLLTLAPLDVAAISAPWANPNWHQASVSLYQHPDFSTWFLEEGDHAVVTTILEDVLDVCARAMAEATDAEKNSKLKQLETAFIATLDNLAEAMVHGLLNSEWKAILTNRLADSAYLLMEQKASTFAGLAATEVQKLLTYQGVETPLDGFIKHYGRRCVEEDLLRLKQGAQSASELQNSEAFEHLVDAVLTAWELEP
ncbi:hypothetical protein [Vampirovibrio sp.]|uniref:hypothetical protein n=1 Tax=Vampirovibrio sp. TaxID=2717857 RepID=UPI003592F587